MSRPLRVLLVFAAFVVAACGVPGTNNAAPTRTRVAELAQIATLTAPTMTPFTAATQTRAVELTQLATLTVPSPTPIIPATQTRVAEQSHLVTMTAQAATPAATSTTDTARASVRIGTSVGQVETSGIFIGLVTDGFKVTAYVCDGAKVSQWFSGALRENSLSADAPSGMKLVANLSPGPTGVFTGTLAMPDGKIMKFSTVDAAASATAGLYSGTGTTNNKAYSIGVIVLPDGQLRGVLNQDGTLRPVASASFTSDGLTADVSQFGEFSARKMTAP